jgi:hypothetical protein
MKYSLSHDQMHSRIITAPDGIDHLITMGGWYWNSLDWMHNETDWKNSDFIGLAWKTAKQMENDGTMENPGNLLAEFQLAFKYHIWFRMKDLINKEDGIINDNI